MDITATRIRWRHAYAFVLAATASAVGLGNIWKFPYILGENGGGAFLLVYLAAIAVIGIPVMMAEVMIGRRGRRSPGYAALAVARESRAHDGWQMVGWIGILASFVIMGFYVVVAGWVFSYIPQAAAGAFSQADGEQVRAVFVATTTSASGMLSWTAFGIGATFLILGLGLRGGLERSVSVLMPLLFALLLLAMASGLWIGDVRSAAAFMFWPDFAALEPRSLLIAVGHAFFTMTLAAGVLMMFGAYLPQEISIGGTAAGIAIADTLIALTAGLAIFPVVFAFDLDPTAGPALMFEALPLALSAITAGALLTVLFFVMLGLAAFGTMITGVQVFVHLLHERFGLGHWWASLTATLSIGACSLITIFSFSGAEWAQIDITLLGRELPTLYHLLEHTSINILLPLSGLMIAVFAGWVVPAHIAAQELPHRPLVLATWRWTLRFVAPAALLLLFWQFSSFGSHLPRL
ncbi:sodium-dependent transporter [Thioalkalivibrio sp. ALE17]|uniref:sodium-dependent transporter n=1 Tax=Thioalkalivibrio sp. ALE17 TaxID=1158173 RepID=UPI000423C752|nr:sodium-dependent transporter [Thioalkalivibrio sp. ALE17]